MNQHSRFARPITALLLTAALTGCVGGIEPSVDPNVDAEGAEPQAAADTTAPLAVVDEVPSAQLSAEADEPSAEMLGSPGGELVKSLAKWFGKELASDTFSWAFDAILTAGGIGGDAEVLKQLHEISAKLDELTNRVNEVMAETKATQAEIVSVELLDAIARIQGHYKYLVWAADRSKPCAPGDAACAKDLDGLKASVRARIDAILDPNGGVIHDVELLRTALVPSGNEVGLLTRWNDYLRASQPFYGPSVDPRLSSVAEYYDGIQLMGANLIIEAYMGRATPDHASAEYYFHEVYEKASAAQSALIAEMHAGEGTLIDNRTKLAWMQKPWSNLLPIWDRGGQFPGSDVGYAKTFCSQLNDEKLGGYQGWRLPTGEELRAVVKGGPSSNGIYAWLVSQGFQWAERQKAPTRRGFFGGGSGAVYYSSTVNGSSGYYYDALRDSGVDYGCVIDPDKCMFEHKPVSYGAWCVTDEAKAK